MEEWAVHDHLYMRIADTQQLSDTDKLLVGLELYAVMRTDN
jgi:hypothetical protein